MIDINPKLLLRFLNKIEMKGNCWEWVASKFPDGYGCFNINGKILGAHRVSYEIFVEEITKGLLIDHLCRNRACVNPWHMEVVTNKINVLRGMGACAINARKTHCKNGHEFNEQNNYYYPSGRKDCRICLKQRNYSRSKTHYKVKQHY